MKRTKSVHLVSAMFVATSLVVVAPRQGQSVESPALSAQKTTLASIQSAVLKGEGSNTELLITTSSPVTYTSYKTTAPAKLVVDFSQAVPAENLQNITLGQGAIKQVTVKRFDTDAGVLSRMEIELVQDVDAVITPATDRSGVIRISFPGFQPATATSTPPPTVSATASDQGDTVKIQKNQTQAPLVVTDVVGSADSINILVSGVVGEYKSFRLNNPERVVVDLFGAKATSGLKLVSINKVGISTARIAGHSDKVRIVLDAQNGGLADALIEKSDSGLKVSFAKRADLVTPANQTQKPQILQKASAGIATPNQDATVKATPPVIQPAIETIDFQVVGDVSRVAIKTKGEVAAEQPTKSSGFVSIKFKGAHLPKHLQRSIETREFNTPILRITPIQIRNKNSFDVVVRIALRSDTPYEFKHDTDVIYIEFTNPKTINNNEKTTVSRAERSLSNKTVLENTSEQQLVSVANLPVNDKDKKVYTGRKVTLEFADAEVRSIFQLLSEVSGKNFVLGDEIGGKISLKLVNVPWDQAFDVIMATKGFESQEKDNVLIVRGAGKIKSELDSAAEKRAAQLKSGRMITRKFMINYSNSDDVAAALKPLVKYDWQGSVTSDKRTNTVIVNAVEQLIGDMDDLVKALDLPEKQVMIEARIVEASSDFTKSLGINWGIHTSPAAGGNKWPFINELHSAFGGVAATAAPSSGVSGNSGAAADISFGVIGTNVKLNMRINAASTAGLVRIISTPRVATLNNKTAKITQGQQIPYTSATSDKIETKFVEAALSLEVTPHINNNGTILMKIDAKNDSPGATGNPPPINKKQATTEMLLRDGETTVIGGIYKDQDTEGEEGVPWLMDIPFLGQLFKSRDVKKSRTEMLIFVTPRILTNVI